jgi:hypothetical protein
MACFALWGIVPGFAGEGKAAKGDRSWSIGSVWIARPRRAAGCPLDLAIQTEQCSEGDRFQNQEQVHRTYFGQYW